MSLSRRSFVGLGSLVVCGTAVGGSSLFAAAARVLPGGMAFSLNEKKVLAFVRSYSANFRLVGASVLGRIRKDEFGELHVLVDAGDRNRLFDALLGAKFAGLHAQGNTLTAALADVDVTIENLPSDEFSARLAAMGEPGGNAFAHDALAYNPETKELSDPFDAQVGGVKMTGASFSGPAALDVALRGTFEAAAMRLTEERDFTQWKSRVLGVAAPAADARQFAAVFLQQLATLAEMLPASGIETLLRSRLIATALKQTFRIEAATAIADFRKRRAKSGVEITSAALWLAALIAPAIKRNTAEGAATAWITHGTRFQVLRSRAALAQAQTVLGV